MKRIIGCLLVGTFAAGSFATDARIIALGRHDNFFMDDFSIYRNPANLNIYPNMGIGSAGYYFDRDTTEFAALQRTNRDPERPYATGILSYSLAQGAESGTQYPMVSLAGGFNRTDKYLQLLTPNPDFGDFAEAFGDSAARELIVPDPVGKIELMGGYAFGTGGMVGAGVYTAFQREPIPGNDEYSSVTYTRINAGVNWPLAKSVDIEGSIGVGLADLVAANRIQFGTDMADSTTILDTLADLSDGGAGLIVNGEVRLFTALMAINGDLVPRFGAERIRLKGFEQDAISFGAGVNMNIDRGFFWLGLEGLYKGTKKSFWLMNEETNAVGGRFGAGLERNVVWDWFLLRVGLSKTLLHQWDNNGNSVGWIQNAEANASDDDFLGIGLGINIENRLKIDAVLAEDLFYTLTNLFSGPHDHIATRLTATYSF